jgi:hypothetical protein
MPLPSVLVAAALSALTAMVQSPLATASVPATARVEERISLTVSTGVLQFVVEPGASKATAGIDFIAGVRATPGRDVQLIAEPLGDLERTGGTPAVGGELHFAGEGDGTLSGVLPSDGSCIVARWAGGGLRRGRIVFTLQGAAPGVYSIPVRLSVSVP